jgi:hypothetical protein
MSEPQASPPNGKKPLFWPIALNLGLLVLAAIRTGAEPGALGILVLVLVVVNSIAAAIVSFSGRIHYVVAFILSALLIGLIGFGVCALMLSNMGSMH